MLKHFSLLLIIVLILMVLSCEEPERPDSRHILDQHVDQYTSLPQETQNPLVYYEKEELFAIQNGSAYNTPGGSEDPFEIASDGSHRTKSYGRNGSVQTEKPCNDYEGYPDDDGYYTNAEYVGNLSDANGYIKIYGYLTALQAYECLSNNDKYYFFCNEDKDAYGALKSDPYSDMYKFNSGSYCSDPQEQGIRIKVTQTDAEQSTPEGYLGTLIFVVVLKSEPERPLYTNWDTYTTTSLSEVNPGLIALQGSDICKPDSDYWLWLYGISIYEPPPWDKPGFPYMVQINGIR